MSYKLPYLQKTFSDDDFIFDYNAVIEHLYDKYENFETIKSYLFTIIKHLKDIRYTRDFRDKQDDIKYAFKKYFNVINHKIDSDSEEESKNNICLIVDD